MSFSDLKMDAALKREREDFKRRAMAVPVVENKKRKVEDTGGSISKKSASSSAAKSGKSGPAFTSKYSSGGSNYKFGVLGKRILTLFHSYFFQFENQVVSAL